MRKHIRFIFILVLSVILVSCTTAYKAQPLPFKAPEAYPNAKEVAGAVVAAKAFANPDEAKEAFGFDIRGAGMLPVEVVFDNKGHHTFELNGSQTFLEDNEGNLWPILASNIAYDRAAKYSKTKEVFKEGAYHGFLGAVAGAVIGAAVGIVTGKGEAIGQGAAIGGATGAVIGGAKGYAEAGEARRTIVEDLRQKSLQSRPIVEGLSFGIVFFPGEAKSAKQLRLQIIERDTDKAHVLIFAL